MSAQQRHQSERGGGGHEGNVLKGLAAGVVGGLVASAVMNQFQALLSKLFEDEEESHGAQSLQEGSPQRGLGRELAAEGKDDPEDDAPERLANAISVGVFDHELTRPEKETAGVVVHYAMGVVSGAIYGAAAEIVSGVTAGAGLPFGAAVWLVADEGVVPAAGLSKSPTEYPLSVHAYACATHLVYGLTTELVRRAVRSAL
jgi:hypothetical protein